MNPHLIRIPPERYASEVLPHTHALWGSNLSYEAYESRTLAFANSGYGRRSFRTYALAGDDSRVLASFKWYERRARLETKELRAVGIGAVFTPAEFRGRGFASAMLAGALDLARSQRSDLAFLFSDIHPQFYKTLGFSEAPSRSISLRADSISPVRVQMDALAPRDWSAVRRCFDAMEKTRAFALLRPPAVWEWMVRRITAEKPSNGSARIDLVLRRGRAVPAYLLARREPKHDALVVEEIGFAGEHAAADALGLVRAAAGDLRRITGWLPPSPARDLLPRGSVRRRSDAVLMAAPLTAAGNAYVKALRSAGTSDPVWSFDHV